MPLWIKIVLALYGMLCVAALALAIIGSEGLFGVEPDGLAGVFAIGVALPWSLIVLPALNTSVTMILVILALCMLLNGCLIAGFGALLHYWRSPKKQAM